MSDSKILIIGKPKSGKSVFLGQFYTRLRRKKSEIKLVRPPENLKIIEAVNKFLSDGKEPETTPAGQNEVVSLEVSIGEQNFVLDCPDYGGEQVRQLIQHKEIKPEWETLLKGSNSWLLFVKPVAITNPFDLSTKQYKEGTIEEQKKDERQPVDSSPALLRKISEQTQLIELVQLMMHARGAGYLKPINDVKLTVVLTCWDLCETQKTPMEVFKEQLPLLSQFITSNWNVNKLKVLGLSAQGFSLESEEKRELYLNELPENFGYMVKPNGDQDKDITLLIKEALF